MRLDLAGVVAGRELGRVDTNVKHASGPVDSEELGGADPGCAWSASTEA
jgi:hypothetical protein